MDPTALGLLTQLGVPPLAVAMISVLSMPISVGVVEQLKMGLFGMPQLPTRNTPFAAAITDALLLGGITAIVGAPGNVVALAAVAGLALGFGGSGGYAILTGIGSSSPSTVTVPTVTVGPSTAASRTQ